MGQDDSSPPLFPSPDLIAPSDPDPHPATAEERPPSAGPQPPPSDAQPLIELTRTDGLRLRRPRPDHPNDEPVSGLGTHSDHPASSASLATMFDSNSRGAYLPIGGQQSGRNSSFTSNLISWGVKHKFFIASVSLTALVLSQLYLFGPTIWDSETIKNLQNSWDWQRPSPASPVSPGTVPVPAPDAPLRPVGPGSFPAQQATTVWGTKPEPLEKLYPEHDPHRGEIPPTLLHILEAEPRLSPLPWPEKAPAVTEEMWPRSKWDDKSKTTYADAANAHKQPIEPDWRSKQWASWRPPLDELAASTDSRPLPQVQFNFEDPSKHSGKRNYPARDDLIRHRQKLVRNAFLHAWEGYKKYAWGHDELKPVSNKPQDNFNGWGATIVDALDTLLVMDLPDQYDLARQHVRDIDFRVVGGDRSAYGAADGRIPVFETAIRYLGGFLSAYDLSGDTLMRDRAEELAQLIMPAFHTTTGVPVGRIRLAEEKKKDAEGEKSRSQESAILSEAGSLLLEFTRLWQVTGNRTYFDRVQRTTDWLDRNMTYPGRLGTLLPTMIYPERSSAYGSYSFGGMADSYYEYLIKEFQLLGGKLSQYSRMYSDSIDDAKKYLIRKIESVPGVDLLTIGEQSGARYHYKLEHLTCFSGGMLGLGARLLQNRHSDLDYGKSFTESCWWAYNSTVTGIGPETSIFYAANDSDRFELVSLQDGTQRRGKPHGHPIVGVRSSVGYYINRPETIESVLYMWRITGDEIWQERGWQMFSSWVTHCMTDSGFSSINDVHQFPALWTDNMESFTFAETFKYYYLLFSPPELISLDEYVFTTEAHPILVPKQGQFAVPGQGSKKFWNAATSEEAHLPSPTSGLYSGGEREGVGGLTNNQKHIIYRHWQKNHLGLVARSLIESVGPENLRTKFKGLLSGLDLDSLLGGQTAGEIETEESCGDACEDGQATAEVATEQEPMPSAEEIMAGTRIFRMEDGTLAVELNKDGDVALQAALLEKLGFSGQGQGSAEELGPAAVGEQGQHEGQTSFRLEPVEETEAEKWARREAESQASRLRKKGLVH